MNAHQGRFGRIEALGAVAADEGLEAGFLLIGGQIPPVLEGHGQADLTQFHLHHPVQRLPGEGSAEDRMPRDHELPGAAEGVDVEGAAQARGHLLHIDARIGVFEGVEEHPLLHGREGVDGFDVAFFGGHRRKVKGR